MRRNAAVALMTAGFLAVSSGAYLSAGPGPALLVAGALLVVLSLLLGWGA